MLVYNTEFIWIRTLQKQSIFWTRLLPHPKYRMVLQCTHPIDFSIVTSYYTCELYYLVIHLVFETESKMPRAKARMTSCQTDNIVQTKVRATTFGSGKNNHSKQICYTSGLTRGP